MTSKARSRTWAELANAYPVNDDKVFEMMLDSPSTRRHLIIPGLWLGNMVGAGGIVPLNERTPEFLEGIKKDLKNDGITHILCFAEGLCCFPNDFKYH